MKAGAVVVRLLDACSKEGNRQEDVRPEVQHLGDEGVELLALVSVERGGIVANSEQVVCSGAPDATGARECATTSAV